MDQNPKLFDSFEVVPEMEGMLPRVETEITLRDLFAAAVLSGAYGKLDFNCDSNEVARSAYAVADAMLQARAEKRG